MLPNGAMGFIGIEAAARKHYGKSAAGLTAREAAILAAVIPNPRRYRTDGTSRYVGNQSERIYQIMVRRGIVIPEYDDVISEKDENNQNQEDEFRTAKMKLFRKQVDKRRIRSGRTEHKS